MSEYVIGFQAVGALVGLVIASALYMIGGRSNKIIRRLGAAFVLTATVNILCAIRGIWQPLMLAVLPLQFAGMSLGYGADITWWKVIRRSVYASAICMSGLLMCFILGGNAWMILPLHIGVAAWSIWLAVKNPLPAAAEETFVCALLNTGLMMYPFTGGV